MSARKLEQSWWVDFRVEGVRYRKKSPNNSQHSAKAYESILRQRLSRGQPLVDPATTMPTFSAFSAEWYERYVKTNNKRSEQKAKETLLHVHLLRFFGARKLNEITPRLIEQYKADKLAAGLAPKTVNNHMAVLSKCLRTAQEWEVLEKVPKIRMLRVPPQAYDFLTVDECEALLAAAHAPVWRDMVLTALRTGMRLGELLALDWADVNMERQSICVHRSLSMGEITSPKNNRTRYVPITKRLRDALAEQAVHIGFVFRTAGRDRVSKNGAALALNLMCRRSGLRPIGWHVLRHTFASHLVGAGVPLRAVQELLGHATIQMTVRYAHLTPSSLHAAVAVLEIEDGSRRGQPVGETMA